MEVGKQSSDGTTNKGAKEISVEVVSQVSSSVLENLGLEDGQAKCDSWVEGCGVVVSNTDESTEGEHNSEGKKGSIS